MEISKNAVFGSWKIDSAVLLVPIFIATLFAWSLQQTGPAVPPAWYALSLVIAFDTPHFFCGFWVMFSQKETPSGLKTKLGICFIFLAVVCVYLFSTEKEEFAMTFVALFSLWHFIRQHQAWFYLALGDSGSTDKQTLLVNKLGINAATWGFFLAGQCGVERPGWFEMNDLFLLPERYYWPILSFTILALLFYVVFHVYRSLLRRTVELSAHLVFLSAAIVWGSTRLFDLPYLAAALIIIPHAVAYVFLLYRYEVGSAHRRGKPIVANLLLAYMAGALFQGYRFWPQIMGLHETSAGWLTALVLSLSLAHYMHDQIFWSRSVNPSWRQRI